MMKSFWTINKELKAEKDTQKCEKWQLGSLGKVVVKVRMQKMGESSDKACKICIIK